MIRLGTAGIPKSCDGNVIDGLKRVRELGLDAMELEFVRQVYLTEDGAREVGDVAKDLAVDLSVHAPYYINLASKEEEKIEASKKRILDSARVGAAASAKIVVFHPGFYTSRTSDEAFKLISEAIKDVREKLDSEGLKIALGPETTGKVKQFGTLDEILEIAKSTKGVVPVIDWAHMHARYNGLFKRQKDFTDVLDKVESALGKIPIHCHFAGIHYSDKGEIRHLILKESDIDYELLAKELSERNPEITLISESPNLEDDALRFRGMLS